MVPYIAAAAALVLLLGSADAASAPNYHGCLSPVARALPYCNLNLTHEARAQSLISSLTLEEKVGLISPDPGMGDTCFAHIHAIPRVGLPAYGWLVECNTGVASSCYAPGQCSTTFAGPTGLGATFDRATWAAMGTVLSTEMRAFSNHNWHRSTGIGDLIGTSAFGPNLNIMCVLPNPPVSTQRSLVCSGHSSKLRVLLHCSQSRSTLRPQLRAARRGSIFDRRIRGRRRQCYARYRRSGPPPRQ